MLGLLIEHPGFVACLVALWRVVTNEPKDLNLAPSIPDAAVWKLV